MIDLGRHSSLDCHAWVFLRPDGIGAALLIHFHRELCILDFRCVYSACLQALDCGEHKERRNNGTKTQNGAYEHTWLSYPLGEGFGENERKHNHS
jgi:hypothetical protein